MTSSIGNARTKRGMEQDKIKDTLRLSDSNRDLENLKQHIEGVDFNAFQNKMDKMKLKMNKEKE